MKNIFTVLALVLALCLSNIQTTEAQPAGNSTTVLILGPSVTGGVFSEEATACTGLGFSVEVVSHAQWLAKSAADFATYRGIILGDPTCQVGYSYISSAEATVGIWGPQIDGHVIINGTDPVFHSGQGGNLLTQKSIAFMLADDPGQTKTGAYISLSCYDYNAGVPTPVPVLDAVSIPGSMTIVGAPVIGCYNNAHITATHPAMTGLTDADLSNWSCSIHEAFYTWDSLNYQVLAIGKDVVSNYIAPDGTQGIPYVLARGAQVISDITLGPLTDTNHIGDPHTLTAVVDSNGSPVVGRLVTFTAIGGPCAGFLGSALTDGTGSASITYTCMSIGTQFIKATATVNGLAQTSNTVTKVWEDNPLPVELSSMTSSVAGRDVTINWITASELNNSGFDIERSLTAGEWTNVGHVAGNGTVSSPSSYSFTDRNLAAGTYSYRLKQTDFNGNFAYYYLSNEVVIGVPESFSLKQNYPNPFNPSTKIDFALPKDGNVTLDIYDNSGKLVSSLVNEFKSAGYYSINFNAAGLSSGVYFYKLGYKSGEQSFVKVLKMSLLK
ncbi:MAG: T9SS type A sorting domain-containing protein [Ignavibacteria bacterium]|nr:T9SS type A sorting domain-containing protein [Ignavibacteria bacterium]